jgi:hypothetical protein
MAFLVTLNQFQITTMAPEQLTLFYSRHKTPDCNLSIHNVIYNSYLAGIEDDRRFGSSAQQGRSSIGLQG